MLFYKTAKVRQRIMKPFFHQMKQFIRKTLDALLPILEKNDWGQLKLQQQRSRVSVSRYVNKQLPEKYLRELIYDLKATYGMNEKFLT